MKKNIGYCYKNRTKCLKNCFQKSRSVDHKATEATREFIRIKIADKIVKVISYCSN